MNNNQLPIQADQAPGRYPHPARQPRRGLNAWPGKRGLESCAVLCLILVIAPTACGPRHAPSSTPKNQVVFDQTVSANLVTPDFTIAGSHQTLAWSCDPSAVQGTGLVLIYIGAAGSDPAAAPPMGVFSSPVIKPSQGHPLVAMAYATGPTTCRPVACVSWERQAIHWT